MERRFAHHKAPVTGANLSEDGTKFVSCDSEGVILLCDLRNGEPVAQLTGEMAYGHGRSCVRYSHGEKCLVAGNTDGSLTIIDLATNEVIFVKPYLKVLVRKRVLTKFVINKHLYLGIFQY